MTRKYLLNNKQQNSVLMKCMSFVAVLSNTLFFCSSLYLAVQILYCILLQMELAWQLCLQQVCVHSHFQPDTCANLCWGHILVILSIFQTFYYYIWICYDDLWSLIVWGTENHSQKTVNLVNKFFVCSNFYINLSFCLFLSLFCFLGYIHIEFWSV